MAASTIIFLDWYTYGKMKEEFSKRLEATAEQIHKNFTTELAQILMQLDQYTKIQLLDEDLQKLDLSLDQSKDKDWLARSHAPCMEGENSTQSLDCTYRHDNALIMFLLDENGDLRLNWTHRSDPYFEGTINVKDRLYVRHVLDPEKPLFVAPAASGVRSYFIEPIISRDSADTTVVVSIPFNIKEHFKGPKKEIASDVWVAAMEQKLTSVMSHNSVPPGGGFAIIDNQSGKVLFHSNVYRNLRENFFQETDMNAELQALAYSKTADAFEGDYHGQGQQFFVKPIQDLPWTLVVFRSKEDLRTFNIGILLFVGSLLLPYFVLLSPVFAFILWRVRRKTRRRYLKYNPFQWLWPHPSNTKIYQLNGLVNLGLLLVGLCIYLWVAKGFNGGRVLLGLAAVVPLISFLGLLTCGFFTESEDLSGRTRSSLKEFSRSRFWYAGMTMTWVLLFAAFPAGLSFEIAKDRELRMFVSRILVGVQNTLNKSSLNSPPFLSAHLLRKLEGTDPFPESVKHQGPKVERPFQLTTHQVPVFYGDIVYPVERILIEKIRSQSGSDSVAGHKKKEGSVLDWYHQVVRSRALNYSPLQESWGLLPPDRSSYQESILDSEEPVVRLEQDMFPIILNKQPSQFPYSYFPLRLQAPLPEWVEPKERVFYSYFKNSRLVLDG